MEDSGDMNNEHVQACRRRMTNTEVEALFQCREDIKNDIDPLHLVSSLRSHFDALSNLYTIIFDLVQGDNERDYISEVLIGYLPPYIDLKAFVTILDECGYKTLAARVFLAFLKLNANPEVTRHVSKSTSGQRQTLSKLIVNLKRMVDDAQFKDPRIALSQLSERFIGKMYQENDQHRKQLLADKCVAMLGAEIDAIAITFDNGLHNRNVFSRMKNLTSQTSNTLLTDGVYFGRLANANAIAGRFEDSENMLRAARCKAYHIGPCFELLFMLVIEVQVRLYNFEQTPTPEQRQALLMWGRVGLECSEKEDLDVKKMWRRSFILRMVFCLVGLGNRANVIENYPVDDTCIAEAKHLLADIDRNWYGIETRRKMFYYVARARICELTHRYNECVDNLRIAMHLAFEGHFEELGFITAYFDQINGRRNTSEETSVNDPVPMSNTISRSSENSSVDDCRIEAMDESRKFLVVSSASSFQHKGMVDVTFLQEVSEQNNETSRKQQVCYNPIATNHERNITLLQECTDDRLSSKTRLLRRVCDEREDMKEIRNASGGNNTCSELRLTESFVLMKQASDGSLKPLLEEGNTVPDTRVKQHNIAVFRIRASESAIAGCDKVKFENINDMCESFVMMKLRSPAEVRPNDGMHENAILHVCPVEYSQINNDARALEPDVESSPFARLQSPDQTGFHHNAADEEIFRLDTPSYHGGTNKMMTLSLSDRFERAPISGRSSAGNTVLSNIESASQDDSVTYLKTFIGQEPEFSNYADSACGNTEFIQTGNGQEYARHEDVFSTNTDFNLAYSSNKRDNNYATSEDGSCNPSIERRYVPFGRDSAGNTPATSVSLEHLNVEQSFNCSSDDERISVESDDLFG